ncbi:MAPEG family protein [Planktotalea sp.]|uniref:MAPEG family protein n=1 Tax=Planktotalea sp. TaxID=2029877 RepID=UPI003F6BD134
MTPELMALTLAALLQVLQFCAYSVASIMQVGVNKAAGPRDKAIVLTGTAGRLQRAMNNHFEGLILFTIAVVVITYTDQSDSKTMLFAFTYLGARILYVPAYVFGLAPWRSLIWVIGLAATVAMLISALI